MPKVFCLFIFTYLAWVSLLAQQQGFVFGYTVSKLYALDLSTGQYHVVGPLESIYGISGHAFDRKNGYYFHLSEEHVYVVDAIDAGILHSWPFRVTEIEYDTVTRLIYGYTDTTLYSLDPENGSLDTIGKMSGLFSISGVAMDYPHDNILFLSQDTVYSVSLTTAEVIKRFAFPVVEIEADPATGMVYGYNLSTLYSLDLSTGITDTVGTLGINTISGHTWDPLNDHYIQLSNEQVYVINPVNAEVLDQFPFPVVEIEYGMVSSTGIQPQHECYGGIVLLLNGPAENSLTVQIENEFTGTLQMEVYDMQGKKLYATSLYKRTVYCNTTIPLSGFVKGIYLISFQSVGGQLPEWHYTAKWVKE
jgi:hypothetical protein